MPTIIAGIILLFSAAGIAASAVLLKNRKKARTVCIVLCAVLAFISAAFIALTLYFGWAVANQPADDMPMGENGVSGADWRTWRSYTEDYRITEEKSVCLSPLDDGGGYAVYDSETGARIGTLSLESAGGENGIRCEDIDGDGIPELGVEGGGETVWFRYTGEPWIEGEGGGCFERAE